MTKEDLANRLDRSGLSTQKFTDWLGACKLAQMNNWLRGVYVIPGSIDKIFELLDQNDTIGRRLKEERLRNNLTHKSTRHLNAQKKIIQEQIYLAENGYKGDESDFSVRDDKDIKRIDKFKSEVLSASYAIKSAVRIANLTLPSDRAELERINQEIKSRK